MKKFLTALLTAVITFSTLAYAVETVTLPTARFPHALVDHTSGAKLPATIVYCTDGSGGLTPCASSAGGGSSIVDQGAAASSVGNWPVRITDGTDDALVSAAGALLIDGSATTQPVSASSLPLPTGAATETTLSTIDSSASSLDTKTPNQGQALMTGSVPVAIASDQSSFTIDQGSNGNQASAWWTKLTDAGGTNSLLINASGEASVAPITISTGPDQASGVWSKITDPGGVNSLLINASGEASIAPVTVDTGPSQAAGLWTRISDPGGINSLLIDASGKISVTAVDQGSAAGTANAWPIRVTDGTNSATVSAGGALTVDGSAVTQPISAGSLPLPTGAATEAKQDTGNTSLGTIASDTTTLAGTVLGTEMQVDVVTSALPTGAATEATLATIDADTSSLAGTVAGSEQQVDVVGALPTGTNTIGAVNLNRLDVIDFMDTPLLDAATSNIPGSAASPLQVVAVLADDVQQIEVDDTTGEYFGVYTGVAASEVLQAIVGPGRDGPIQVKMASGERVSLRSMTTTAITSGNVSINFQN